MTRARWSLPALFLLALGVRLYGIDWDQGHFFHPDERRIAEAVAQLQLKPLQLHPHFFAYGSFPFYVTRLALSAVGTVKASLSGYDGAVYVGRALSALWGAAGVLLLFALGRRLFGERVGLRAALFLALAVLPVQNAHFGTNDVALTTLVTLALYLLVRFADGGFAFGPAAGFVIGLALATKVSALPLGAPVLAALYFRWRRGRPLGETFGATALIGFTTLFGFALGEPYAFLDAPAFLRDVAEQSNMVRHAGVVPYTTQYVGTLPWIYPLTQVFLWGLAPVLGLAAFAGTLRALKDRSTWRTPGPAILLAFLVPYVLLTGAFDVKFPRYLLPAYPLLLLFAAEGLERLTGRVSRVARTAVVVGSVLTLAAFLRIYGREHTMMTASRWGFDTLAPGTRVLQQDWDEGFPFPLPDRPPEKFRITTFPFYDPDGAQKTDRLARELAKADVVVFQTKRIYGAVTRAPERYPATNRFFRLMFSEDLGFVRLKDFASRPGLLGLSIPDELADESFTVYDHPRILVFKNHSRLSEDQLRRRLNDGFPHLDLDRTDLLRGAPARFASAELPDRAIRRTLPALLLFALLLFLLGRCGAVFVRRLLPEAPLPEALGKVVGPLVFVWAAFLGASTGLLPFRRGPLLLLLALLLVAAALARRGLGASPTSRKARLAASGAFWGAFVFFAACRAFGPEIYWGEKPMDFAFLNALERSVRMPPPEPWFSGAPLHYTYLGHFAVVTLGKTIGVAPGILFNLGIALVAALLAAALLFAGRVVGGSTAAGVGSLVLGLVAGNLNGVVEVIRRRVLTFDTFWATSRVVPNAINEYPLWSLLFADLHAHLLALPFAVAFVGVLAWLTLARPAEAPAPRPGEIAVAALLLGMVGVTNAWSLPTFLAFALALFGAGALLRPDVSGVGARLRALARAGRDLALLVAGAFALWTPFWLSFRGPERNWGREVGPWTRPHEFALVFGLFLALLLPAVVRWRPDAPPASLRWRALGLALFLVAATVSFGALFHGRFEEALSVRVLASGVALACAAGALAAGPGPRRTALAIAAFAFAVVAGTEFVYVWDRMNTVFKFYFDAEALLAVACGGLLAALAPRRGEAGWGARAVAIPALALAFFTTAVAIVSGLRSHHVEGPQGTLDGAAYLPAFAPGDAGAIAWLNANAKGLPTIVEAWGPSYQEYARVSMHTGLPTVIGWDYHVQQRAEDRAAIERRKGDVAALYRSRTPGELQEALHRYRVSWVVCGDLEGKAYGGDVRSRMETFGAVLRPVYRAGGTTLFQVVSSGPPAPEASPLRTATPVVTSLPPAKAAAVPAKPGADPGSALKEPLGLVRDVEGIVYVADSGHDRIALFDSALRYLESWGRSGAGSGELSRPTTVALGPGGKVYVADAGNHRVAVFDRKGKWLSHLGGDLVSPAGVAVSPAGDVFVSDAGSRKVLRFGTDGRLRSSFGIEGKAPGQTSEPGGLAVDAKGDVWVCDAGGARLAAFSAEGVLRRAIPVPGWKKGTPRPQIAFDALAQPWVTVPLTNQVRVFDPKSGRLLRTIRSGEEGQEPFQKPIGITVDARTQLALVSDSEGRLSWLRPMKMIRF